MPTLCPLDWYTHDISLIRLNKYGRMGYFTSRKVKYSEHACVCTLHILYEIARIFKTPVCPKQNRFVCFNRTSFIPIHVVYTTDYLHASL